MSATALIIIRPGFQTVCKAGCVQIAGFLWKCVPGISKLYACSFQGVCGYDETIP